MKFQLKQYIYFAKNMAKMRNFYEKVLGLEIVKNVHEPEARWLELGGNGFKVCLHKSPTIGATGRNKNKLVFAVDSVKAAREYLVKNKIKMGTHHHWTKIEACDGHDPEGNKFQIASVVKK